MNSFLLGSRSALVVTILSLTAYGCASAKTPLFGHPKFGIDTTPIVTIGYFTHAEHLDVEPCPISTEGLEIDCFGPYPHARAVIKEVLFGHVPFPRLELLANYTPHPERFPIGSSKLQLILFEGYSFAGEDTTGFLDNHRPLHKLKSGGLAVPAVTEDDLPSLPCSGEELLKIEPLDFASPHPFRHVDEYSAAELASLAKNQNVQTQGKRLYIHSGVKLDSIRKAIEKMAVDDDFDPCWSD